MEGARGRGHLVSMPPRAPVRRARTRGHTLAEMAVGLLLLASLLGTALPGLRGLADGAAVAGAREEVVAALSEARGAAVGRGGSALLLDAGAGRVTVRVGADSLLDVSLARRYGVALALSRGRAVAELDFDALGLGRVASESVRITRGAAEARLVISGYGRVRRR